MELGGVFFGLGIGHERGRYGIGQCPLHEVKRLLGHCDIIANENAKIEVREAFVSNLLGRGIRQYRSLRYR